MVATPARIGLITHEFRTVEAKDEAVHSRYGKDARDSGVEPVETFFDSMDDVEAIVAERFLLLKRDRRRFRQIVAGLVDFTGDLDFSQSTPAANVIDTDRSADLASAIVEIGLDHGANKTTLVTWGAAQGADELTLLGETILFTGESVEMI